MAWLDARDGSDAHRLEAEIANEPQWVVFDDASEEDRWAAYELEDFVMLATWWSSPTP